MIDFLRNLRWYLRAMLHYRGSFTVARQIANKIPVQEITLKDGIRFYAPSNSNLPVLLEEIFFSKDYLKYFTIHKDDIVVDIGANIGIFSIFASTMTTKKIYAFEALNTNIEFLHKNIAANNIKNIVPVEAAVCGRGGNARLFLTPLSGGHYLCDINTKKDSEKFILVPAITLEQIFVDYRLARIDFLKMDCEGAEGAIFIATSDECFKRVDKIALEFHDAVSLLNRFELNAHLKKVGFKTRIRSFLNRGCGYIYAWR